VVAGGEHSCALQPAAITYCWGFGGTGSTVVQPTATVRPAPPLVALSAGRYMTCGLTTIGEAQCWGHTFRSGSPELLSSPTPVAAAVPFEHVDVGRDHVCALDPDGRAYCWGANDSEQLGIVGPPSDSALTVPSTDRFDDVAAGWRHSCGVTSSGELRCWGVWPYSGNPPPRYRTVATPEPLKSVSAQSEYTCALSVTGRAYCMGRAYGLGDLFYPVISMRPVLGDLRFTAVEAGSAHGCGQTATGVIYCWGRDYTTPGDAWLVPTKMRPTT
jgi:alpha-tubulin suppressor-like RCC1 family protein